MSFKDFIRKIALGMRTSKVGTSIMPLDQVKTLAVFMDPSDPEFKELQKAVFKFFPGYGINPVVFAPTSEQLGWLGSIRKSRKWPSPDGNEDMFISLVNPDTFAVHLAAVRSRARFKIGRSPLPGNVYDIVLSDREGVQESTLSVFRELTNLLTKIK